MKKCPRCLENKDLSLFSKDKNSSDGHKNRCKECDRGYYLSRKDILSGKSKTYYKKNKEKICNYQREYQRNRKKIDMQFKLKCLLRNRVYFAIKNSQKVGSAVHDLGCSVEELKQHLESQFQPGMSWNNWNHNGWHIDHIKPLSSFDLEDRKQFLEACHYTNLQPLWSKENWYKGSIV
jgi:hypothetical protein